MSLGIMVNQDDNSQVRDLRNGDWFWVNKTILENDNLTSTAKLVYSGLALFANNVNQNCYPSLDTIAKMAGSSKRTAMRAIKQLEEYRYLRVERIKGKKSIYYLLKIGEKTCGKTGGDKRTPVTKSRQPVTPETPLPVTPEHHEQYIDNNTKEQSIVEKNNLKRLRTMKSEFIKKTSIPT